MVHQKTCRRCGRRATSGIVDGRCSNVGACTRRAVKAGKLRKPEPAPNTTVLPFLTGSTPESARFVGESNGRVLRRDLRQLQERIERLATLWSVMTGTPGTQFTAIIDDVIKPALAYLEEHRPTGMELRYKLVKQNGEADE